MRRFGYVLLLLVLLLAGWWLLGRFQLVPSLSSLFRAKPVQIAPTGVWIKEIRPLAQLITVSAYDEIVVDTTLLPVPGSSALPAIVGPIVIPINEAFGRRLVVIGKVVSHAGIDMQAMDQNAIQVVKDSVHIQLPPARVLDTIINPSGVDVFIEKGTWDSNTINLLKEKMKRLAAMNMESRGLLQQSEQKATELLTDFFQAAGFNKVSIQFTDAAL